MSMRNNTAGHFGSCSPCAAAGGLGACVRHARLCQVAAGGRAGRAAILDLRDGGAAAGERSRAGGRRGGTGVVLETRRCGGDVGDAGTRGRARIRSGDSRREGLAEGGPAALYPRAPRGSSGSRAAPLPPRCAVGGPGTPALPGPAAPLPLRGCRGHLPAPWCLQFQVPSPAVPGSVASLPGRTPPSFSWSPGSAPKPSPSRGHAPFRTVLSAALPAQPPSPMCVPPVPELLPGVRGFGVFVSAGYSRTLKECFLAIKRNYSQRFFPNCVPSCKHGRMATLVPPLYFGNTDKFWLLTLPLPRRLSLTLCASAVEIKADKGVRGWVSVICSDIREFE